VEGNRDWKVPAALILAGLALLIAFSGRTGLPFIGGQDQPGQTIVIQNAQPGGPGQATPVPVAPQAQPNVPVAPVAPIMPAGHHFGWGYGPPFGYGAGSCLFPFLLLGLLGLFIFKVTGRRHWHGYGGGYGPGPWRGGPPPPAQPGQPTQGPQPGQGPGHWEWHPDTNNGTPSAAPGQADNQGDIMRPGEGDQE